MNIWIVDDEINLANGLKGLLKKAATAQKLRRHCRSSTILGAEIPAVILLDQRLPDGDGIDVPSRDIETVSEVQGHPDDCLR